MSKTDFVQGLEPGHFVRLENNSFISPEYLKRESDLIYHVMMEEREKLHSVIRSLKRKGFKISYISEITGLSIEEILSMDL